MANKWDPVIGTKPYNKNMERINQLAENKGYVLNLDEERIKKVVGLMTMNFTEYGKYYCPCKQNHPLDPSKDVTCLCPELADEISKDGNYFCRLFYSKAC